MTDTFQLFQDLHPVLQALLAGLFTWALTAAGASLVFFSREPPRRLLDAMLGFAAGVMIAASFWSLLAPAIELSAGGSLPEWWPALVGFLLGAVGLRLLDMYLPHLHLEAPMEEREGPESTWHRSTLLIMAITIHNIPEGLAVGVAFGAAANGDTTMGAALAVALGIGLQNFPEGTAVSMPLRREGLSRRRCFWYGQLSAVVEPLAAVLGAGIVFLARPILPYALAFAAGAMIFVVIEELIPESQRGHNTDLATMAAMLGFAVMMTLDVGLG